MKGSFLALNVRIGPTIMRSRCPDGHEQVPQSARDLRGEFDGRATILHGDGSKMSLPDNEFSSVVCFTMLHHVPTRDVQDGIFSEALRVLGPGGVFAGSDSRLSIPFRVLHIGDTMNVVDPDELPERLRRAGFEDVEVTLREGAFKFRARKPSAQQPSAR